MFTPTSQEASMILSDTAIAALSIDEQRAFTYSTPEEAAVVANHARQDAIQAAQDAAEDALEYHLWLLDREDDHGWSVR